MNRSTAAARELAGRAPPARGGAAHRRPEPTHGRSDGRG